MSGTQRPPPPIVKRPKPAEDGSSGAKVQMKMLCKWLMQELLDQTDEDMETTFVAYGDNFRELHDTIIYSINSEPGIMQHKHGLSRINNIFDDYAGIAPEQRAFTAPADLKVFRHVGFTTHDGGFKAPVPDLTPMHKAPMVARSPVRSVPFPPTDPSANPMGYTSPTSPGGREASLVWPLKQNFLEQAEDNRLVSDKAGDRRRNPSCNCLLYTSPSPRDS